MCTGSDSGSCSGDLCQNFELLSASSSSVNEKDNKLSENSGISGNPISLMVDCIRMLKEVLFDPIPWALSVVCEEPSLLKKIVYFFAFLFTAPAYYALAIPFATLIGALFLFFATLTVACVCGFFLLIYLFWKVVFGAL